MYETFDHTADLGLRIRAADLDALFAEAGEALTSLFVENPGAIREEVRIDMTWPPDEVEYLFFDWLKAILSHFEVEKTVFARFVAKVGESGLTATAWGERLDETRHELAHEVKAITYHGLTVERDGEGWLAEVIVDI